MIQEFVLLIVCMVNLFMQLDIDVMTICSHKKKKNLYNKNIIL